MIKALFLFFILALAAQVQADPPAKISPTNYETVPEKEAEQIAETMVLTTKLLQQRYSDRKVLRGVHPKDHGCVTAEFTVNDNLPKEYQQGVFKSPGKTYSALIRFSNATALVSPDINDKGENESRGMAIKLFDVKGKSLLGKNDDKTQDFLLINTPMFAFSDVAEYLALTQVQIANNDDISSFFSPITPEKLETLKVVGKIKSTQLGDPLESRYFSASPFLYGKKKVVKFAVTPRNVTNTPVPTDPSPNYLREALKKSLDPVTGKQAVFDFQVQFRTSDDLPIENTKLPWSEEKAPFKNVATITIDKQDFENPKRISECENTVFTPWHGVKEHQPLGGINRLRLGVYNASSQYRLNTNEASGNN